MGLGWPCERLPKVFRDNDMVPRLPVAPVAPAEAPPATPAEEPAIAVEPVVGVFVVTVGVAGVRPPDVLLLPAVVPAPAPLVPPPDPDEPVVVAGPYMR